MTTLTTSLPTTPRKLAARQHLVNEALERALPSAQQPPAIIHDAMRYCVFSGGKRFRPLLCLGACEAVGAPARQALPVACAIELIHTYSLVHDDLPAMDNADQRRGQPSCHRKFGEGNAILVGDALLTLAFELLGRDGIPRLRSRGERGRTDGTPPALEIIRTISRASGTTGLIGGQVLDLQAISQPRTATERTLVEVAQQKTAALITASVVAGALAGGASAVDVQRLKRYGRDLGLAFQLIDDLHDQEGLAQAMGAEAARTEAQRLIDRALAALEPFGKRAQALRQLATWLVDTA